MKKEEKDLMQPSVDETVEPEVTVEETPAVAEATPKKSRKLNSRRLRYGSVSVVLTLAVVVALVIVCVIGDLLNARFPLNWDLTADDTYTFSEESEQVAALVDREVEIVVFMKEDTFINPDYAGLEGYVNPEQLNKVFRQFYEFTNRYNALTDGKVTVKFVDAINDPTAFAAYEKYSADLDAASILFLSGDRHRIASIGEMYSVTQSIDYSSYSYVYTIASSNVESMLSTNLQYLCRKEVVGVTVLTGHGEYDGAVSGATEVLKSNGYEVHTVDFTTVTEIPADTKALLIAAPTKDFSAKEIERLREWLNNGDKFNRHLFVLPHNTASCPNLFEFLEEEYYIQLTDNMVAEEDTGKQFYYGNLYTVSTPADTDYTKGLTSGYILSPGTRHMIPLKDNNTEYERYVLSLGSFSDTAKLYPIVREENASDKVELVEPEAVPSSVLLSVFDSYNNDLDMSVATYVAVFGSKDFLTDGIRNGISTAVNEAMFVNVANDVLGNETAIAVPTRSLTATTLEFSAKTALWLGLGVFVIAIPLAMLVMAFVVFFRRRHL